MKNIVILFMLFLCFQTGLSPQSCLPEGIYFDNQDVIDNFQINYPNCTEIEGFVTIWDDDGIVTNLNGLSVLTSIGGTLAIWGAHHLTNLSGLNNLTSVGGNVEIWGNNTLSSLSGLNNLSSIGGTLDFWTNKELTSLEALEGLTSIGDLLLIWDNDALTNFEGLDNLSSIGGELEIWENEVITSLSGLENLTSIGGWLDIYSNPNLASLADLINLTSIGGKLTIEDNPVLTTLFGLDNIEAGSIQNLKTIENSSLAICDVKSICDYLADPGGTIEIEENSVGCNSQTEVEIACNSSIIELNYDSKIVISPNPFSYKTSINFYNPTQSNYTLTIFNQLGNQVFNQDNIKSNKIEFFRGKLPNGIYFVELKGEKVFRGKMVVK